jgi:arylsulfatase A-like enzyme
VENERLGRDATTDLLFLGLSGFDYLGHDTGPDAEAMGALIGRADAQIAEFLQFLDQRLGPTGYWLAVTADHGISPVIGGASKRGLHARSVDGEALLGRIRRELGKRLARGEGIVLQGRPTRVWFDAADLARRGVPAREAAQAAGEAASSFDGILGYVAPSASNLDAATIEAYRLSTYPGRSPDLFLVPQPFVLVTPTTPANHGTPWIYDASVPLLLIGAPFRPGTFRERCSPADLAPTLASALGIPSPAMSTGRVLAEALRGR